MNYNLRSAVVLLGDVAEIFAQEIKVITKALINVRQPDGTRAQEVREEHHPVLCPKDVLAKIKEGKPIALLGWITRHGDFTKVLINHERWTQKPKEIEAFCQNPKFEFTTVGKSSYLNMASLEGVIRWKRPLDGDPSKRNNLTVGIARPGDIGSMVYAVCWGKDAHDLEKLVDSGVRVEASLTGFMRMRAMTGARHGDYMYELNAGRPGSVTVLDTAPIQSLAGLSDQAAYQAAMAYNFDPPQEPPTGAAPPEPDPDQPTESGAPEDDDIPF